MPWTLSCWQLLVPPHTPPPAVDTAQWCWSPSRLGNWEWRNSSRMEEIQGYYGICRSKEDDEIKLFRCSVSRLPHTPRCYCKLLGSVILSASLVWGFVASSVIFLVIHNYGKFPWASLNREPSFQVLNRGGSTISAARGAGQIGVLTSPTGQSSYMQLHSVSISCSDRMLYY